MPFSLSLSLVSNLTLQLDKVLTLLFRICQRGDISETFFYSEMVMWVDVLLPSTAILEVRGANAQGGGEKAEKMKS